MTFLNLLRSLFVYVTHSFLDTVAFELLPHIKGAEKEKLKRVRPPRFFRDSNIPLQPYSEEENIGQGT